MGAGVAGVAGTEVGGGRSGVVRGVRVAGLFSLFVSDDGLDIWASVGEDGNGAKK